MVNGSAGLAARLACPYFKETRLGWCFRSVVPPTTGWDLPSDGSYRTSELNSAFFEPPSGQDVNSMPLDYTLLHPLLYGICGFLAGFVHRTLRLHPSPTTRSVYPPA